MREGNQEAGRGTVDVPPVPQEILSALDEPAVLFPPDAREKARARIVHEQGLPVALEVSVPLTVRKQRDFSLDARLAAGGETLALVASRPELALGESVLTVRFPLAAIDADFEVTLILYSPGPPGSLSELDDAVDLSTSMGLR